MTDDSGDPTPKSSAGDPPAANQNQDEPIPTTPEESAQAGESGESGAPEDSDSTGAGHEQVSGQADQAGENHGVPVAGTYAVGSSGPGAAEGGGIPAVAPGGKPDGEVDTRT